MSNQFSIDRVICEDGPSCDGDRDGNGVVNGNDLAIVLASWGSDNPASDINGDGNTDGIDLASILATWGVCP